MLIRTHTTIMLVIFLFVNLCRGSENSFHYSPSYLEDEITAAVAQRNRVIADLVPDSYENDVSTWSAEIRNKVRNATAQRSAESSLWHQYLVLLLYVEEQRPEADNALRKVFTLTDGDPAALFMVFFEFNRHHLTTYADLALDRLEKMLLSKGVASSSVISTHLLQMGLNAKIRNNRNEARRLFSLSHRFNPLETASIRETMILSLPFRVTDFFTAAGQYITTVSTSWQAQLALLHSLLEFIHILGTVFVIAMTILLCFKYFPGSLHGFIHFYPPSLPATLRIVFVALIAFSSAFFGFFILFWLAAFSLKPHLRKNDYLPAGIALLLVLLSPVDAYFRHKVESALMKENSIAKLSEAIHEYSTETSISPDDPHTTLVAAINAVKQGRPQTALKYLRNTEDSFVNNPVFDNTRGAAFFMAGFFDSAAVQFKNILSYDSKNYCAYFNLSRTAISTNNASEGMEYLKQAAALKPDIVNTFVHKNDDFYSDGWPLLRQFMFTDYTPAFFWKHIFSNSGDTPDTFRNYWGITFLGIPPTIAGILFMLMSAALVITGIRPQSEKKLKRLMECKYCGKIICRRCTSGILCNSCSEATRNLDSSEPLDQIRNNLVIRGNASRLLRIAAGNMLFPGAGTVYSSDTGSIGSLFLFTFSCICYTVWYLFITGTAMRSTLISELFTLALPMSIFNLYWLARSLPTVVNQGKRIISAYIA